MAYVVIAVCFGLAGGIVGRIKGSSFVLWFLVGFCLPFVGLIGAILYRWERHEPHMVCPRCGASLPITNQVCTGCGEDIVWQPEAQQRA
jgi:hypothetical protein